MEEANTATAIAGQTYRGYPVESYLTMKGKIFWRSGKLLSGGGQPLGYESLETLHRFIDAQITSQEWKIEQPILVAKIGKLLLGSGRHWTAEEMMIALNMEDEQKFSLALRVGFGDRLYPRYVGDTLWLRSKEMDALRRAARRAVGTYSSAPVRVISNSRKKPKLTGEYAKSRPIGRNRFKTVQNSTTMVTVGENWKY
jgi:hypothetical protein